MYAYACSGCRWTARFVIEWLHLPGEDRAPGGPFFLISVGESWISCGVLHEPFGPASASGLGMILLGSWLSMSRAPPALESELGSAR